MVRKLKYVLFFAALISMASVGTCAWAGHGGHGGGHGGYSGGHGGHGWGGGGGASWHGGHGHFDGYNHFASYNGWGHGYGWGRGYGNYFRGGYWPYLAWNYLDGWPYRSYYRPYATYSYPYYGYPNYGDDCYGNYTVADPSAQYIASLPVNDAARVEVRLPDPDGKLWVEGRPMSPTGTIRQFKSPVLSEPYVYTFRAEWYDGDRLVTDERKVDVKAGSSVIVDFNQPQETVHSESIAQPAHASGIYASVTAAELRDWLRLR